MKIGVVGSGICGLASATHLARDGHNVTILERFDSPRPLGAGLLLQPSGLAALETLDLRKEAERRGAIIHRLYGTTPNRRTVLDLRYSDGQPGDIGIGIHRASLFNLLLDAARQAGVSWKTGQDVTRIVDAERGVIATSENGEQAFDLVMICDGAHSTLRRQICPDASDRLYPWGALWRIAREPDGKREGDLEQVYNGCKIMAGLLPVGDNPADPEGRPGVSFFWSIRHDAIPEWRERGLEAFKTELNALWDKAGLVNQDVSDPDAYAHAQYRDVRCSYWQKGRIIMLGDAAHGMSPQLGQGANLALEDARDLASQLRDDAPLTNAMPSFRKSRMPGTRYYAWASWLLTPVFQSESKILGWLRDLLFGLGCRLPGIRGWMAWTLAGRGRLPF